MRILITGVAGLLGSRLAEWIFKNSKSEVVGIDDLSGGYRENIHANVHFYKYNLLDDKLAEIFENHKPDIVYHFAAYAAEGLSPFIRRYNYENNLLATVNVINNCINHDVSRLVFTSSMAVYGDNDPPFCEDMIPSPIDPYGIAKSACEKDISIASKMHNLDWCIIRPHNVYGENQNIWDRYRNVLGIWMNQFINDKPLTIFGDGDQKRAFSYIGDCLPCFWKAGCDPRASQQIINLGGAQEYSINETSDLLIEVMGGGEKTYYEARHEAKYAWCTVDKSVRLLDYVEQTSLKEGLQKMWTWAKSQPRRHMKIWDKYEVDRGIYSFWKN